MKVYKVVRVHLKKDLISAFVRPHISFCTRYEVDKNVSRNFGLLFAFDTLKNAKSWAYGSAHRPYQIYEADATPSKRKKRVMSITVTEGALRRFWANHPDNHTVTSVPEGTIFCKDITLRKLVYDSRWEGIE